MRRGREQNVIDAFSVVNIVIKMQSGSKFADGVGVARWVCIRSAPRPPRGESHGAPWSASGGRRVCELDLDAIGIEGIA